MEISFWSVLGVLGGFSFGFCCVPLVDSFCFAESCFVVFAVEDDDVHSFL